MALDLFNVIAGIATLIGLGISLVQTMRYRAAERNLEQLKRSRNADIWLNIAMVLGAYETIDDVRQMLAGQDPPQRDVLSAKVGSARRCIVNQYMQLLKEAVLDEDEFTEATVQQWRSIGRLENEWRVAQARKFVRSSIEKKQSADSIRPALVQRDSAGG